MHLVVGATGTLGGMVARRLLERGDGVRILVREGADASDLVRAGAETVTGDLKDRASLDRACAGIDVVVTTANSAMRGGEDTPRTVEMEGNRNLIDAARAARVKQFVLVSAIGATEDSPVEFLRGKAQAERHLRESGLRWTIVAPNLFMAVWGGMVVAGAAAEGRPVAIVGAGERRHSFISIADVAAFTAAMVGNRNAYDRYVALGGPEPLTWKDVVERFNRAQGTGLVIRSLTPAEALATMPEAVAGLLAGMDTYDSPIPMDDTYREFDVRPTTIDDWAARAG